MLQLPVTVLSRESTFLWLQQRLSLWYSFHLDRHRSAVSLSLKCFPIVPNNCPMWLPGLLLQFPHPPRADPVLLTLLFFSYFLHPTDLCMGLYILFHWSGTPACSQLVFCKHFCVWRCIPDVSMERDVLHIHLLLSHLFSPYWLIDFKIFNQTCIPQINPSWSKSTLKLYRIQISKIVFVFSPLFS